MPTKTPVNKKNTVKTVPTMKLAVKKPTSKTAAPRSKKTISDKTISAGDKILFVYADKVEMGTVGNIKDDVVAVRCKDINRVTLKSISASAILAVCNPRGTKELPRVVVAQYAGRAWLTEAGEKFVSSGRSERAPSTDFIPIGAKVVLREIPFGYTDVDFSLRVGQTYQCLGFIGERVITSTDVDGELAIFHQDHAHCLHPGKMLSAAN